VTRSSLLEEPSGPTPRVRPLSSSGVPHVAVTAIGSDRPGIVAAVTGVLMRRGGNLEDTAMTNLGGHFAMVLVVEVPDDEDAADLERALAEEVGADLGLTVTARPIAEAEPVHVPATAWAVTVYGADRPGIVHRVTTTLAEEGANIVDLSTRVVGPDRAYVLLIEVTLPADADPERLGDDLRRIGEELGVQVHLRADDADVL
jgi:glycine cleavage system transcriptional repressor